MLRYTLDARIDGAPSDALRAIRLFSLTVSLLLQKENKLRVLFLDRTLLAPMSMQQYRTALRILQDICRAGDFQCLCSMDEDTMALLEGI